MKINDKHCNAVFGGILPNDLDADIIFEDEYDMHINMMEARQTNIDTIKTDKDEGWIDFNVNEPTENGLYIVKLRPNPFSTFENGVAKNVVEWSGTEFILPIGRSISAEVLYWKKI